MVNREYEDIQREIPPFGVDAKEVAVLRELKRINDRDNGQLKHQNQQLIREKNEIMNDLEQKL
jgi:hypothetical protein